MKKLLAVLVAIMLTLTLAGCEYSMSEPTATEEDIANQNDLQDRLSEVQPTPTNFDFSLERFNLIKRAYWVNGQRDIAQSLSAPILDMPIGYILLIDHGVAFGAHTVFGKVSSLESYLTPSYKIVCDNGQNFDKGNIGSEDWCLEKELADVDGSYGQNANGIFFFNTYGEYVEWTGTYFYSDYAFDVPDSVVVNRLVVPGVE